MFFYSSQRIAEDSQRYELNLKGTLTFFCFQLSRVRNLKLVTYQTLRTQHAEYQVLFGTKKWNFFFLDIDLSKPSFAAAIGFFLYCLHFKNWFDPLAFLLRDDGENRISRGISRVFKQKIRLCFIACAPAAARRRACVFGYPTYNLLLPASGSKKFQR